MAETDHLDESIEWIDLGFVERERTPDLRFKSVFSSIWLAYNFRIQNNISKGWVSNEVAQRFTTGCRNLIYSPTAMRVRIRSQWTKQ